MSKKQIVMSGETGNISDIYKKNTHPIYLEFGPTNTYVQLYMDVYETPMSRIYIADNKVCKRCYFLAGSGLGGSPNNDMTNLVSNTSTRISAVTNLPDKDEKAVHVDLSYGGGLYEKNFMDGYSMAQYAYNSLLAALDNAALQAFFYAQFLLKIEVLKY